MPLEVSTPPPNKPLIIGMVALIFVVIALIIGLVQGGSERQKEVAELKERLADKEKELAAAWEQKGSLEAQLQQEQARYGELQRQLEGKARELEDQKQVLAQKEAASLELENKLTALLSSEPTATVERNEGGGLKIQLADTVFFPSASADLKPSGQELLGPLAESLKASTAQRILIVGHTDNWPIHKNIKKYFSNNRDLSAARAVAAAEYLASQGIPSDKLAAVGMGESRPIADNETEEGRSKNRRIEIYLVDSDKLPF
jgi:chemotaxis protein MotB